MSPRFLPALTVSVNKETGSIRAAYLRVREGEVAETREISEGRAFADYDASGMLLGIELLGPCEAAVLDQIAAQEPEPVRQFVKGSAPRELILN
jgi:uncharacterized protein YuzE